MNRLQYKINALEKVLTNLSSDHFQHHLVPDEFPYIEHLIVQLEKRINSAQNQIHRIKNNNV